MVKLNLRERLKLYVITDGRFADEVMTAKLALEGGATAIQLRMKNAPARRIIEVGKRIRRIAEDHGALFVVNDRIDIALIVDADGVHLGSEDVPILEAKEIAPNLVVGATVRSPEMAREAERDGADYLGAGSVFPTSTKENTEVIGLETLREIVESSSIPVVAVGGINHENVSLVLKTGVAGIAVVSAIVASEDIRESTIRMRRIVDGYLLTRES